MKKTNKLLGMVFLLFAFAFSNTVTAQQAKTVQSKEIKAKKAENIKARKKKVLGNKGANNNAVVQQKKVRPNKVVTPGNSKNRGKIGDKKLKAASPVAMSKSRLHFVKKKNKAQVAKMSQSAKKATKLQKTGSKRLVNVKTKIGKLKKEGKLKDTAYQKKMTKITELQNKMAALKEKLARTKELNSKQKK